MADKYQLTTEGLNNYKNELDHLYTVDRPNNIQALADARAQGDLSENADYDAARNEQARIEARIKEIEYILKNYVLIDGQSTASNIGKKITFHYIEKNIDVTYAIVGKLEANPKNGTISDESPLGKAALGAHVGDVITVSTENADMEVKVLKIE